jgi:hypothetical protein
MDVREGQGGQGRKGKEPQADQGRVVCSTTHLPMGPQRWLEGTASYMPCSTLPLRVRPVQLQWQLLRKWQLGGGRNRESVGSLCRGWQRRQNWGRSRDGTKGTGRTNGTRGTEGASIAKNGAQTQTCTQEGRKVRREEGTCRFPKAGRHTPAAAIVFSPLVLLFPPVFFGILFRLPMVRCGREEKKGVGGCCGRERREMRFEIVQKNVQPRNCPFGTVWRKHAFTALGGKLNACVQIKNSNEWEI